MKRLLFLVAILFSCIAHAQSVSRYVPFFSKDSLPARLQKNWCFHKGDSAAWADPAYNDSGWVKVNSELRRMNKPFYATDTFNSIGWLRYSFTVDSTLVGRPLAFSVTQYGASEFYLDGKKIRTYGMIGDALHTSYYDPQFLPVPIVLTAPGIHVFAVRYANYNAARNAEVYRRSLAGFKMRMGFAGDMIDNDHTEVLGFASVFMFMFGLFVALCIIHLFLFLYYKAERSNLFFSIFCFCISLLFLIPFLNHFSPSPRLQMVNVYTTLIVVCVSCISFSGLSNGLFGKFGVRFWIIVAFCVVAGLLYWLDTDDSIVALIGMVGVISLEAMVLIIRALVRRKPGARIIGIGLIPLALVFLIIVVMALSQKNIEVSDASPGGQLLEVFAVLAVLFLPICISIYLAWNFARINKELKLHLKQVEELSAKALLHEQEKQQLLARQNELLEHEVAARTAEVVAQKQEIEQQHAQLKVEKKKSDDLLLNILPEEIAEELKQKGTTEAKYFDQVTVLFTDFVNFTHAGERMSAQELVDELHACFKSFDDICSRYNVEKIKTIGDAYLAVCGLPVAQPAHAENVVKAALEIRDYMAERRSRLGEKTFEIRIGVHSGSVVAGIVGVKKFAYDIWGDTVNTAARMEQHSEAGKINISEATYRLVKDKFTCTYRGKIEAKNKGQMDMYFVTGA